MRFVSLPRRPSLRSGPTGRSSGSDPPQRAQPVRNVLGIHNAADLANRWTLAAGAAVQSSPTVAGGVVYIASNDGSLHAVRPATGKAMWTLHTSRPIQSTPAAAHGVVYVGTGGGGPVLLALNAGTGARLWGFSLANTSTAVLSSPAVANGVVYAGATNGYLYALSAATGKKLWSFHQGAAASSRPQWPAVWCIRPRPPARSTRSTLRRASDCGPWPPARSTSALRPPWSAACSTRASATRWLRWTPPPAGRSGPL